MKLKRLMALVMSVALTSADPFVHVAAQVAKNVSGTLVQNDRTTAVAAACVRLRSMDTNAIVSRTVSDGSGSFSLSSAEPGTHVVEVVDCADGSVLAVSDALDLAASPLTLKTVVVVPSVRAGFLSSTAFLVLAAASAVGITVFAIRAGTSTPAVSSPEQ